MNLEALARSAGAAFFARATVSHTSALTELITRALSVSGFSLIEIISNCHVIYGRMNNMPDASRMIGAMEARTLRTSPTLQRRSSLVQRMASGPLQAVSAANGDPGVSKDLRIRRGIIFQRPGSIDFSQRYYDAAHFVRSIADKGTG
jgi:hypothetical protein